MFRFDNDTVEDLFILLEVQPFINTVPSHLSKLPIIVDKCTVILFDVITLHEIVPLPECLFKQLCHGYDLILFQQFNVGSCDAVPDVVEPRFELGVAWVGWLKGLEFIPHFEQDILNCVFELLQFRVFVLGLVEHDAFKFDVPHPITYRVGQR